MSASEKLRELGRMDDENEAAGELYERLPQIVAVVEAAEQVALIYQYAGVLAQELTALDKALSTEETK